MAKRARTGVLLVSGLAILGTARVFATPDFDLASDDDRAHLASIEKDAAAGNENAVFELEALLASLARLVPPKESKNYPGDLLVEIPDANTQAVRMRSLRALALDAAERLPKDLRQKLIDNQRDASDTERKRGNDDEELLLRRYPLAPGASEQAWRLATRAFEAGDELAAASLDRLGTRLAALQIQGPQIPPAARIRRASGLIRAGDLDGADALLKKIEVDAKTPPDLLGLLKVQRLRLDRARARREALEARKPAEGLVPDLLASYAFKKDAPVERGVRFPQAPLAAHRGDTIFASDGSRLLVVDARAGELRGRLPQNDEDVAPPATGIPGTVSIQGDVILAPLFYETFPLLPARGSAADPRRNKNDNDEVDPSVRGGFFSLFAIDARALRTLWWDGDVGTSPRAAEDTPHGRPPGADAVDERTWKVLAGSHVVGRPLQDGRRVYVPLVTSATESQVWIAAYDRKTGESQPLVLVPSWATFLALAPLAQGGQPQSSVMPIANPRLVLDPEGRVIVQTDLGTVAALDARTGALEWIYRFGEIDPNGLRARQRGRGPGVYLPSNDPPVVVPGDGTRPSIVVAAAREEECWIGLSCEDGTVVWRSDPWTQNATGLFLHDGTESPRLLALAPDVVLGYGGLGFVAFDGATGASLIEPNAVERNRLNQQGDPQNGSRPIGPGARVGKSLVLLPLSSPAGIDRVRPLRYLIRRDEQTQRPKVVVLGHATDLPLQGAEGPVSLIPLEDRLVATTLQKVLVYSWGKRGE
jgi:outer membrane protein assembly factor BamB